MTELMSTIEKLHRLFTGRTVVRRSIDMLDVEQRRATIQYLLDGVDQDTMLEAAKDAFYAMDGEHRDILIQHVLLHHEPRSSSAGGLPQTLRGAMHALTRNYPANLVVDAAMLEMPECERAKVAQAFLPVKPTSELPSRHELVLRSTGSVLVYAAPYGPSHLRLTEEDGSTALYLIDRTGPEAGVELEYRPEEIVTRTFYVEHQPDPGPSLREKLDKLREERKEKLKQPEPKYTLVDEDGRLIAQDSSAPSHIQLRTRVPGSPGEVVTSYVLSKHVTEYDQDGSKKKLAAYREVKGQ